MQIGTALSVYGACVCALEKKVIFKIKTVCIEMQKKTHSVFLR